MTSFLRVIMVRQGDAKKCVYMGLLRPGRVTASCSPVCAVAGVRHVCIKWERSRVRRCECPSTASSTTFTTQASAGRTTRGTSARPRRATSDRGTTATSSPGVVEQSDPSEVRRVRADPGGGAVGTAGVRWLRVSSGCCTASGSAVRVAALCGADGHTGVRPVRVARIGYDAWNVSTAEACRARHGATLHRFSVLRSDPGQVVHTQTRLATSLLRASAVRHRRFQRS